MGDEPGSCSRDGTKQILRCREFGGMEGGADNTPTQESGRASILLNFMSTGVPYPDVTNTQALSFIHPTQAGVFKAMATLHFYYLDLIGFYCWVRRIFDNTLSSRSWDESHITEDKWVRWRETNEWVGYLVDLHIQRKIMSCPLWIQHSVLFHYVWDEGPSTNEHFRC